VKDWKLDNSADLNAMRKFSLFLHFTLSCFLAKLVPNFNLLNSFKFFKTKIRFFKDVNLFDRSPFLNEIFNPMYLYNLSFIQAA